MSNEKERMILIVKDDETTKMPIIGVAFESKNDGPQGLVMLFEPGAKSIAFRDAVAELLKSGIAEQIAACYPE